MILSFGYLVLRQFLQLVSRWCLRRWKNMIHYGHLAELVHAVMVPRRRSAGQRPPIHRLGGGRMQQLDGMSACSPPTLSGSEPPTPEHEH
jgi:hypothetical protein